MWAEKGVGLAWDGEEVPVRGDRTAQGRLWPLKAMALGGREEVDRGSRRNWEKPGPGLGLGHPPHARVGSPDLSTKVCPHLNSYLPHLAGWRDGPSDAEGPRGKGRQGLCISGLLLDLQSLTPHAQVPNLNALAC